MSKLRKILYTMHFIVVTYWHWMLYMITKQSKHKYWWDDECDEPIPIWRNLDVIYYFHTGG
jgi:hypothetical protein